MSYNSKYKGSEVESLLDKVDTLEIPDVSGFATKDELSDKVDKVSGKQLSTEDFTSALKTKLEGLSNYDDTELSEALSALRGDFDKLVSGDTTTAIKTFNEVIAFLDGISDSEDLDSIIAGIELQIAGKQNQLVSGTNIKTINGTSILGSGNIVIEGDSDGGDSGIYYTDFTADDVYLVYQGEGGNPIVVTQELLDAINDNKIIIVPAGSTHSGYNMLYGRTDTETAYRFAFVGADETIIYNMDVRDLTVGHIVNLAGEGFSTNIAYAPVDVGVNANSVVRRDDTGSINVIFLRDSAGKLCGLPTGNASEETYGDYTLQKKLVSGENIKEIGGQSIVGQGNITFKTINGQPIIGTGNIEIEGSNNQPDIYVTRFTMEELWEGLIYAQENVESYFELSIDGQGLTEAIASHKSILIPRADYNGYAQVISVQYDREDYTYLTIVDNTTTIYIGCSSNDITQGSILTLTNNYITIESVDAEISPNSIVKRDSDGAISVSGIWDDGGSLWATESSPEEMQAKADYIFQSKIEDIDDIRTGAALGKTALQSETYKGTITGVSANGTSIATSGVANIPAASTSAYGVTKLSSATNSTSTTLAATPSAVKAAYDLANSYKGTVTGVKINGTTKSPSSGIVDLGTVITAHQTLKTINGESIVGSGNITISGGSGPSSGSGAYSEVNHGTNDTTFALTPNTFHIWDEVSALTLTLGSETAGVANEFLFQFTSGSESTSLILPDDIKWTNDEAPVIEANKIYQISILKGLGSVMSWSNANTALIENHITYDAGNFMDGGTITFEYPTASELTFGMDYYESSTLIIPQGSTQVNIDWYEPFEPAIRSISPTEDSTYKYILR